MANVSPTSDEISQLVDELNRLRIEHGDLDAAIQALMEQSNDQLQIQRLKKRKLALKDRIRTLENTLTPDIIA